MDIGKDLQEAYEQGRRDALNELMEYTYGMLTAEKFGLQHKIKSIMDTADTPQTDLVQDSPSLVKDLVEDEFNPYDEECLRCKHLKRRCEFVPTYCQYEPKDTPQTDCAWK